jgi:hypothetical protein
MKAMTEIALHRTADDPSPCLQCHHGQHSSTTSHPAACGLKTMTIATPGCAPKDGVACKPS